MFKVTSTVFGKPTHPFTSVSVTVNVCGPPTTIFQSIVIASEP